MRLATRSLVALSLVLAATVGATLERPASASSSLRGEILVSAAASLSGSFQDLGREFRRLHPRVRLRFNFASTSTLVAQIESGAPVSLFASADMVSQRRLARGGLLAVGPRVFANNSMQIAVKRGNPLGIRSVSDLSRADTVALCVRSVPCGSYAARVLARAGVTVPESSITRGVDAKATLAAVAFGDADAAIVYATDVRAAGRSVTGVVVPTAYNAAAVYGISTIRGGPDSAVARAFIDFVRSAGGRRVLRAHGFRAP